jgi:WD40 repeat protein
MTSEQPPLDRQQLSRALQRALRHALPDAPTDLGERLATLLLQAAEHGDIDTPHHVTDPELVEALRALLVKPITLDGIGDVNITVGDITGSSAIAIGIGSVALNLALALPEDASAVIDADQIRRLDIWSEAPDTQTFFGRTADVETLQGWLADKRCKMAVVSGLGGAGKSFLATYVARQVAPSFDYVIWRSLRNARPLRDMLIDWLMILSDQKLSHIPEDENACIDLVRQHLQARRCLLILDNLETVLEPGEHAGQFEAMYRGYGRLLQDIAGTPHQSCLLVTTRELPADLVPLIDNNAAVRSLRLGGLTVEEAQRLVAHVGLTGGPEAWRALVERYSGNPQALKIVASFIDSSYNGLIDELLAEEGQQVSDLSDLLQQQFQRLSETQAAIMYWLAINREPCTRETIQSDIVDPGLRREVPRAIPALFKRSLIEKAGFGFTLQNVVMEFVTGYLIQRMSPAVLQPDPDFLNAFALVKAQAPEYIRAAQARLILGPIATQLDAALPVADLRVQYDRVLDGVRQNPPRWPGYVAANIVHLVIQGGLPTAGLNCSGLPVRGAYLRGTTLRELDLRNADLDSCVFTETFGRAAALAYGHDGALLAVGTGDGEIRIWETEEYRQVALLEGHQSFVRALAFSPDGSMLASCGHDLTVRLWDLASGECLHILQGHDEIVFNVAYAAGGRLIASASGDKTIRLWDTETGECVRVLEGHEDLLAGLAFSPDGLRLASASNDRTIRLWDTTDGREILRIPAHDDWIISVAFSPDGATLASTGEDRTIRLWNIASGQLQRELRGHEGRLWSVAYHPAGALLASGSYDKTVRLWDAETGDIVRILLGHTNQVWCVRFSPDGLSLASSSDDHTVRIWDIATGRCTKQLEGYRNPLKGLAVNTEGTLIASTCADNVITLTNAETGERISELTGHTNWVKSLSFLRRSPLLVSASQDHTIRLWNLRARREVKLFAGHTEWIYTVALSPNERTLASGGIDRVIRIWSRDGRELRRSPQPHVVRHLLWTPDGSALLSGSQDPLIRILDPTDGSLRKVLEGHRNWVLSLSMTTDCKLLASGSGDKTIRIWDWASGETLAVLEGHSRPVLGVAFSPDGKSLVSVGADGQIRLWDVASSTSRYTLEGHVGSVMNVAFFPDGRRLISGGEDETIRIWDGETGSQLRLWRIERPYERLNITGASGLTEAQRETLLLLGAVDELA